MPRKAHLLVTGLMTVSLLSHCSGRASDIVATAGKEVITIEDFLKAFKEEGIEPPLPPEKNVREIKKEVLERMIERRLLLQEAKKVAVTLTEEEEHTLLDKIREDYTQQDFQGLLVKRGLTFEEWKERMREDLLMKKLAATALERQTASPPQADASGGGAVTDDEIRSYYHAHQDEFMQKEEVRIFQIVLPTEKEAVDVRRLLMKGTDFKRLAKNHSLTPEKEKGGDLGYLTQDEMIEELSPLFSLEKGKISNVVKSPYGYHVVKIGERRPAHLRTIVEVKQMIRESIAQEGREMLYTQWLSGLRKKWGVTINDRLLAGLSVS